jgi:hypothetical protein
MLRCMPILHQEGRAALEWVDLQAVAMWLIPCTISGSGELYHQPLTDPACGGVHTPELHTLDVH